MLNTTIWNDNTYTQDDIDLINDILVKAWAVKSFDKMQQELPWCHTLLNEGVPAIEVAMEMACVFGYMMDYDALADKRDAMVA
jgi:hypothetical protein